MQRDSDQIHLGYYLVAFVDILGQAAELRRFKEIPHDAEHLNDAVQALKRTVGLVRSVRDSFDKFLRAAKRPIPINPIIAHEYRARLSRIEKKFTQRGFSDCFVITVPLFGEADPVRAIRDIHSVLHGVAGMSLVSMAQGKPLRGGIDIERGIEIYPDEIYGPGLLCAYELEKNEAQYPRILVGDGLIGYLESLRSLNASDRWLAHGRNMASETEQLICEAPDDGKRMVHILSPSLMTLSDGLPVFAGQAHQWVKSEHGKFAASGNNKLEKYYARLLQYFDVFGSVKI